MSFKDVMKMILIGKDRFTDDFKDDPTSRFKANEHFDVRPYNDLHFDLIYAHCDNIYSSNEFRVYIRKYKNCLLKFFLVDDFSSFKDFDFSNDNLKKLISDVPLKYSNESDFSLNKEVNFIIFSEKNEKIKEYCFLNAFASKNKVIQYFIYDSSQNRIINYRMLRPYLKSEYRTGIFFDLSAIDRERY